VARLLVLDRDHLVDLGTPSTREVWTTMSTASVTSAFSAVIGNSDRVSASWQMNRRRESACRADPAWIVVKPLHTRGQREQQREGLPVTDLTDDRDVRRHAEEAGDEPPQVDLRRSVGPHGSASTPRSAAAHRPRTPPPR
jgi:hypothetical protein